MNKKIIFILAIFLMTCCHVYAADHYCSPTGSDTWSNSTSIGTPCSIETARTNMTAGDTVYLRGGNYTISSEWRTAHAGTGEGTRVILMAYPGETPVLSANGLLFVIRVDHDYWTFDGLTINHTGQISNSAGMGIIGVGSENSGDHTTIQNCTLNMISSVGHDNIACISLKGLRSDYAKVINNTLIGQGLGGGTNYNCGIQALGGPGAVGYKILNNNLVDNSVGIMVKHINADTSFSTGAEIAYNYIKGGSSSQGGIYGNPQWINIHDNIIVGSTILFGDNGGFAQGNSNLLNHNTVTGGGIELWSPSEGPIVDCTFNNNIFNTKTTYGSTESLNTWDYNMYGDDAAIGAHDIGTASPTFVGGGSPTTIAGFELSSGSSGYHAAADSSNFGANVSLVGVDAGEEDITAPVVSNISPTGEQSCTSVINETHTTDETATCRIGANGAAWAAMAEMDTTGGTSHGHQLTGLSCDASYQYDIRCQDTATNESVDNFDFSIAADVPAPNIPVSGCSLSGVSMK